MSAPALTVSQNGLFQVSGDQLNTYNQTCDTFAQLRAFIGVSGVQVYARGRYAPLDGYQGQFYWKSTGSYTDNNYSVIVPNGVSQGAWLRVSLDSNNLLVTSLNVLQFGADPTNTLDSTAAFVAWFAALKASPVGTAGFIPAGTYKISSTLYWDFAGARSITGTTIYGAGQNQSLLNFTQTTGTGLQIEASGGSGPSSVVPYTYNVLRDIGFTGNTTGTTLKIGQDNGADVIESSLFQNLLVTNANASATSALRIAGCNAGTWNNIVAGCLPATASVAGAGTAVEFVMAAFNTFTGCSWGNANKAVGFTNLGNAAVGFSYGNTFLNLDIENTQYAIFQSNCAASDNTFIGGQMYTIYAGGYLVSCAGGGNNVSGGNIIMQDVNNGLNPLYGSGGTSPALDPSNQVGVIFRGGRYGTVVTPSFPASTATYTNTTGQVQMVIMTAFGTMSAIVLNGQSISPSIPMFIMNPQDHVVFTYSGSPSFYFRNLVN